MVFDIDVYLPKTYIQDMEGGGQTHGPAAMIKITLMTLKNERFVLELSSKDTVNTLRWAHLDILSKYVINFFCILVFRAKAAEKLNADVSQIRLITAGKELPADSETLQSHHISDGHTVHAILRPKDSASAAMNHKQVSTLSLCYAV